jgi:hypothetical protein
MNITNTFCEIIAGSKHLGTTLTIQIIWIITNLMQCLIYWVITSTCIACISSPSSGGNNVYMWQLVRVVLLSWLSAGLSRPADSQLKRTTLTSCNIYTLLPPDDGLLASPKHVEVYWLNKLKTNSAASWFHYLLSAVDCSWLVCGICYCLSVL